MENKTDKKSVGARIQALRKKNNETQKDLADIISSTPNSISKLENGEMGLTFDNMLLIAEHYKVSLDYLCKGEGGSDLLETLNTYISLRIANINDISEDSSLRPTPILSINRSYFEYLVQVANALHDTNIPSDLREQWIQREAQKFCDYTIHDNYSDFCSMIPVSEKNIEKKPDLHIYISNSSLNDILKHKI